MSSENDGGPMSWELRAIAARPPTRIRDNIRVEVRRTDGAPLQGAGIVECAPWGFTPGFYGGGPLALLEAWRLAISGSWVDRKCG
jgi:hypothetical protein